MQRGGQRWRRGASGFERRQRRRRRAGRCSRERGGWQEGRERGMRARARTWWGRAATERGARDGRTGHSVHRARIYREFARRLVDSQTSKLRRLVVL